MDRPVDTVYFKHYKAILNIMNQQLLIGIAVGLLLGGVGGWFLGSYQATSSINAQLAAQEEEAGNPFEDVNTNPLENVKTNPYENVKTNPFE